MSVKNNPQTRMTKQRRLILSELRKVCTHPTADELYQKIRVLIPQISLGTIYRNLDFLTRQGDIIKLEYASGQKRFDGNPMPHSHVRCLHCGCVRDVPLVEAATEIGNLAVEGFHITGARLEFDGICTHCSEQATTVNYDA